MKIKNIIFSSLGTLIVLFCINFYTPNKLFSSAGDKIFGHAWNDNIGWISFNNCTNMSASSCVGVDYGVTYIDNNSGTHVYSGYAWNDNVGWISFESSDVSSCNNGNPRFVVNSGFAGSAKILSLGNTGCIDLSGVNLSSGSSTAFSGYAWNDIIGWVDFTGVGRQALLVPSVSIVASPSSSVSPNSNVTLTWTSQNLSGFTCTASNNASLSSWTGTKAVSGTTTFNIGLNSPNLKSFTINCTDGSNTVTSTANVSMYVYSSPWFSANVNPSTFVEGGANVSFDIPLGIYGSPNSKTLYTAIGTTAPDLAGSTFSLLYDGVPVPQAQPNPNDTINPYDPRFLSLSIGGNFVIRMTIPRNLPATSKNNRVQVVVTDGAETHSTYFDITPLAQIPEGICGLNGVTQGNPNGGAVRSGSVYVPYGSPFSTQTLSCTIEGGDTIEVSFTGGTSGLRLSAFPQVVSPNSRTILRWSGANVNSCVAYTGKSGSSGGVWTGQKNSSGNQSVLMGSNSQLFTIECNTPSGRPVTASTIVGIKGVDPGLCISGNPLTGKGGRLSWCFGKNILPAPFYKEE